MLEIFLFVCVAGAAPGTPNYLCKQHKMADMQQCVQAAQTFKATTQDSATREKESRVFLYCAPEGNWHDPKNGRGK